MFDDDIDQPLKQSRSFRSSNYDKSENLNYIPYTYSKY